MKNIIWQKPDGGFAVTSIADIATDSAAHAAHLKAVGAVPADWIMSAVDGSVPEQSPAEIKAQKLAVINAARDRALSAGLTHEGQPYHSDPTFQSQLQAFLLAWQLGMLAPTATVNIRRKDNTTALMDKVGVGSLTAALMTHVQGIYAASWVEKDAL